MQAKCPASLLAETSWCLAGQIGSPSRVDRIALVVGHLLGTGGALISLHVPRIAERAAALAFSKIVVFWKHDKSSL